LARRTKNNTSKKGQSLDFNKSQAKATWITSWAIALCVVISTASLYFSIQAKLQSDKESCYIKVERVDENYATDLSIIGSSGGEMPVKYHLIKTFWDCTVVNTGNNPITLISYSARSLPDSRLEEGLEEIDFSSKTENAVKLPHSLSPADSVVLRIYKYIKVHPQFYEFAKRVESSSGDIMLKEAILEAYKNQIDIFGNPIECSLNKDTIGSVAIDWNKIVRDDPFLFTVKTAKGSFFNAGGRWYDNSMTMPFLQ